MKSLFITDLNVGDELVNEPFLLQEVVRRKTKDNRPFLLGNLRDKTGFISCVFWDVPDYIENGVRAGKVMLVTGRVVSYKDAPQINITDMNDLRNPDMSNFLPSSVRPRQEMIDELIEITAALSEPWQTLVSNLLLQEPFLTRFANSPAARSMHHAYIGGLLEHTLSMARIGDYLADHYRYVNKELLMAGVLLHDIGKAIEYTIEDGFAFSEDGRLVGHIVRGITMIEKAAAAIAFPETDLQQLIHLVASHHGTQEWGSPVIPRMLEAVLLHQIDLLDSRIQGFIEHVENDDSDDTWTAKSSYMFNTELRRPPGMKE